MAESSPYLVSYLERTQGSFQKGGALLTVEEPEMLVVIGRSHGQQLVAMPHPPRESNFYGRLMCFTWYGRADLDPLADTTSKYK